MYAIRSYYVLAPDETLARLYMREGVTFAAVGADIALLARGAEALA